MNERNFLMCYPKPGPRCSYHAKKQLIIAKQNRKNTDIRDQDAYMKAKTQLEQAELDYDSTPAGMAILKLRIERGEDHSGTYQARLDYCKANRKAMLEAIKAQDKGDTGTHEEIKTIPMGTNDFIADEQPRQAWAQCENSAKLDQSYAINGENLAKDLNEKENEALHWYTSDGFTAINSQLHKDSGTYIHKEQVREYSETKIREAIKHIDTVFERRRREEPIIVYRGVSDHAFPQEIQEAKGRERYAEYAEQTFTPGSTHNFPEYISTSMDPGKARSFSRSDVIMEIKAKSTIPVGFISSWGDSEKEMLIQRNRTYKVVGIKKDIEYGANRIVGNGNEMRKMTVIQLEELD